MIQDMFESPLPFHLRLYKWNISRIYHSSILAALYVYAWIYSLRCFYFGKDWASSTGLTAVSKFKPRLPAQWAVGTHRIGPSRMEKVTSRMNWPIRNSTQIRIRIELVGNTIMWNPSLFFISNRFYKTQNNFGPLNDHIITEYPYVSKVATALRAWNVVGWYTVQWGRSLFIPWPFRPKGYCRCLRLSVCLFVCPIVKFTSSSR